MLFVGPLPEPVTGQSLACEVFLEELTRHHPVEVVDVSKKGLNQGIGSPGRILEVARIVARVWRGHRRADVIYLTISQSVAGNVRDLLIYLVCRARLDTVVIHLHGGAAMRVLMAREGGLLRRVNAWFLRRVGAVVVLGERLTGIYDGVVPPDRLHVVPNFALDYLFATPEDVSRKFEDVRPLRVLFLSNLIDGKGYLELLDAYLALPAGTRDRLTVDFAGRFESDAEQDRFLARIDGIPHVSYHGTVYGERKRALFHEAHLFCLPTYYPYEGQPISLLEAYASGCAVITTDHAGIGDVFTAGVNGYEVEKRSVPSLRDALATALAQPEHLEAFALTNLSSARRDFRTSTYNANLLSIVRGLTTRDDAR